MRFTKFTFYIRWVKKTFRNCRGWKRRYTGRSVPKYLPCVVLEIRDTEEKSFSGLARTIYAGIREISIRQSFESSLRFTNETISSPARSHGMSYSPWTSGKLYLREAVITNPVEIVRELETWNNFTAFKPGSTLRCAQPTGVMIIR